MDSKASQIVKQRTAGQYELKPGALYPLLKKLERDGLIQSRTQEVSEGPDRKYFCLTAKGETLLRQRTSYWYFIFFLEESRVLSNELPNFCRSTATERLLPSAFCVVLLLHFPQRIWSILYMTTPTSLWAFRFGYEVTALSSLFE